MKCESAQDLSHEMFGATTSCGRCAVRAQCMYATSVEVQVQCVNVVIGVVLGELHVIRIVPFVVCDDAVVRRTLVLIALHRSHCFRRRHFSNNFAVLEV